MIRVNDWSHYHHCKVYLEIEEGKETVDEGGYVVVWYEGWIGRLEIVVRILEEERMKMLAVILQDARREKRKVGSDLSNYLYYE